MHASTKSFLYGFLMACGMLAIEACETTEQKAAHIKPWVSKCQVLCRELKADQWGYGDHVGCVCSGPIIQTGEACEPRRHRDPNAIQ